MLRSRDELRARRLPSELRRTLLAAAVLVVACLAVVWWRPNRNPAAGPTEGGASAVLTPALECPPLPVLRSPPPTVPTIVPEPAVVRGVVEAGDTISALLGPYLRPQEIHALAEEIRPVFPVSQICAGRPYLLTTLDDRFQSFEYEIDAEERLRVRRSDDGFEVERIPITYTVQVALARGTIRTSLFEAVEEIGEGPELALALADIFAWDVDFILDVREGDSFQAVVERRYREGELAGYGKILAAEFVNQGETFRAIRFQDGKSPPTYYDSEGKSVRKAFLKAPLAFTRISSGFSQRRFHPITKAWKAHPAIDYAAPAGTPIRSVGNGTIAEKGFTSGNGNYVKIRHNAGYESLYLHMSRFGRGIANGRKVTQGQVIGYVGSTGLATGPHLCFRMYKNGSPVNPLRVKSAAEAPVSEKNLAEFLALADRWIGEFGKRTSEHATLEGGKRLVVTIPPGG